MRPWRNSFVTRWAALFASLIIAVVLVSSWLRDLASGLTPRSVLDKFRAAQMIDVHLPIGLAAGLPLC